MNNSETSLGLLLQRFFRQYLVVQKNVSPNTILSYRDAWKLYLSFLCTQKNSVKTLNLDDVNADNILCFLEYLENIRGNSCRTRNQRLAAFISFANFVLFYEPVRMEQMQRILCIPQKKYERTVVGYLTKDEVASILSVIDKTDKNGKMHYAILYFMYNTGARVSEVINTAFEDLQYSKHCSYITIHGKGGKDRLTPIWDETAHLLMELYTHSANEKFVFQNRAGLPITRSGVSYIVSSAAKKAGIDRIKVTPHIIRHTTAMHLLQSGVDINLIRMWLGHTKLDTTHQYMEADVKMKRDALERCGIIKPQSSSSWTPTDELLDFLKELN